MTRPGPRRLLPPLVLFLLALSVRLFFLAGMEAYPRFERIKNRLDDQVVLDLWAKSIARGDRFDYAATGHEFAHWARTRPGVYPQAPLYPFFLGTLYRAVGFRYDAVRTVQMLLGAATAVLVYLLALGFLRRGTAFVCGVAAALYGPFVFYEATFLRASIFGFVAALGLYGLTIAARGRERRPAALWLVSLGTGLALGAGVLMRSNFVAFALPAVGWLYWQRRRGDPETARPAAAAALLGLLVAVLPVMAVNSLRDGRLAFISSNGPYNFFLGNVHDASGTSPELSPHYFRVKESGPPESVDLLAEALRDMRRHPAGVLGLYLRKLAAFFAPQEIPNNLSYAMARKTNPRLGAAFVELYMLLPAAVLGMAVGVRWGRGRLSLLYLFVGLYAAGTLLFFVLSRLRQPAVLGLILFAGIGLEWLWRQVRERRVGRAAGIGAALVAVALWLRPGPADHRPTDYAMAAAARYTLGEEREGEGRLEEARREYARAVALNPDHREARARVRSLGPPRPVADPERRQRAATLCEEARREVEAGRFGRARRLLRRAAALAPGLATPHHYLSNIRYLEGDRRRAMEEMEKAVEREPENERFLANLRALRGFAVTGHSFPRRE